MTRLRFLLTALLCTLALATGRGDDKKDAPKLTLDLAGANDDEKLAKDAPENGVIASEKAWEKLAKAWDLKEPPKVDFTKELLVVATTRGSKLTLNSKLDDKGDLKVLAIATRDLRPGFRYAIKSVSRDGVKTVNGKELPKDEEKK